MEALKTVGISGEEIRRLYPEIWKHIEPEDVTDFDYNNGNLWITTIGQEARLVCDEKITSALMENFAIRTGNGVGVNLNPTTDTVYSDSENLRITCVDKSQSPSGISVMIRKFTKRLRISWKSAADTGYATPEILSLLHNCVLARRSITFCGLPGWGKTECLRFFASQIPKGIKVVSIEDVGEIGYSNINEGACLAEFKVRDGNYAKRMECALRMNPGWIFWGETRGAGQVKHLLECWSNGVPIMTTIHVDDGKKVPDRVLNMLDTRQDSERIVNQIYDDLGTAVLVEKVAAPDGSLTRKISQVCFFWRQNGKNHLAEVVQDGVLYSERLPVFIRESIEKKTGHDIFTAPDMADMEGGDTDEVAEATEEDAL